jgi:hypothetical protein
MALNLSDLTSPSTSDDVLSDIYTTADQGDGIALMDDLSPNDIDATQSTALYQPVAYVNSADGTFARFDGSDDHMSFTLADPITNGTVFFATKKGSYAANINLAAGTHNFDGNKISTYHSFANDLVALLLFDFVLGQSQIDQLKSYFVAKGAVEDYGTETSLANAWFFSENLVNFPPIKTGLVTDFNFTWSQCKNLINFALIDVSAGESFIETWNRCKFVSFPAISMVHGRRFGFAWLACSSLENFPSGVFDNWNPASIFSGVFNGTWGGCTSLTSQSVENILTSIDTSGKWATTNGTSGGTALNDPVIDIDYDGSGLTPATTAAITSLQGKGWGINISP